MQNIANRLKSERIRLNLKKSMLASIGGVANGTYTKYEDGSRAPDANFLANISTIGVDLLYVLNGITAKNIATTPMEIALLDNYRNSTEDVRFGVSALLAKTGRALERAYPQNIDPDDMPNEYKTMTGEIDED